MHRIKHMLLFKVSSKWLYVLILAIVLFLSPLLLFQSHSVGEEADCSSRIIYNQDFYLPFNCDACDFLYASENYQRLWWEKEHLRQNRPLHIVTVHYIGNMVKSLGMANFFTVPNDFIGGDLKFKIDDCRYHILNDIGRLWPYYIGYIILNFFILTLAIYLFCLSIRVMTGYNTIIDVLLISAALCLNQVTKSFLFTPHSQMFALLSMTLAIYAITLLSNQLFSNVRLMVFSLILGILMLYYGSFIYIIPAMILFLILNTEIKQLKLKFLIKLLLMVIIFIIPTLIYIFYLNFKGLEYFNIEIKYRQFVWVIDALKSGNTLSVFREKWTGFLSTFNLLITTGFLTFILILSLKLKDIKHNRGYIVIYIIYLIFTYFMGYYKSRITFISLLPILFLTVFILRDIIINNKTDNSQNMLPKTSFILTLTFLISWFYAAYTY